MVLNRAWLTVLGVAVLAWSGPSASQRYRADEFLNLDLSRAVLSPEPLGPATGFSPGPLDVTVDRGNSAARANAELLVDPKSVPAATVHAESKSTARAALANKAPLKTAPPRTRIAHARVERPAPRARALVALHGRNPMEAQARDTRIQAWPCRSGGICNWKR